MTKQEKQILLVARAIEIQNKNWGLPHLKYIKQFFLKLKHNYCIFEKYVVTPNFVFGFQ